MRTHVAQVLKEQWMLRDSPSSLAMFREPPMFYMWLFLPWTSERPKTPVQAITQTERSELMREERPDLAGERCRLVAKPVQLFCKHWGRANSAGQLCGLFHSQGQLSEPTGFRGWPRLSKDQVNCLEWVHIKVVSTHVNERLVRTDAVVYSLEVYATGGEPPCLENDHGPQQQRCRSG